jgi:5'-3' exonuclease
VPAPLLIADVPWLLYRSFFALPKSITGEQGRPVNALLGTVNALLSATELCGARALAACMGAEEAAYRVEMYPAYHAHRDPMPAALEWQWEQAPALLESLGMTVSESQDLEADDAMLSYAKTESEAGGRALLLTGDRDLYQAVDEDVAILELGKRGESSQIGPPQVRERYGIDPAQVPDFIALRGDPSDGLPGAPGIGAKTAAELLRRHGSLQALLADAISGHSVERPRVVQALTENAELLLAFREIATLVDIPVTRPKDAPIDHQRGATHARRLGMNRLARRLEQLESEGD